jgi:hypothetical protein
MESLSRVSLQPALPGGETLEGDWQAERFGSVAQGRRLLSAVLASMAGLGYPERARARVRQALGPALLAALRCSWRDGPSGPCTFRQSVRAGSVLLEVEGVSHGPGGAHVQGPHGAQLLQAAVEEAPFWARSYTWVRGARRDGRVSVCNFHSAP